MRASGKTLESALTDDVFYEKGEGGKLHGGGSIEGGPLKVCRLTWSPSRSARADERFEAGPVDPAIGIYNHDDGWRITPQMTPREIKGKTFSSSRGIIAFDNLNAGLPGDLGSGIGAIVRNDQDMRARTRGISKRLKTGCQHVFFIMCRHDDHRSPAAGIPASWLRQCPQPGE